MGVTQHDVVLLERLIKENNIKSVIELGAQQQYTMINYGRYMSEWYKEKGINNYVCIDLNGENGALTSDLSRKFYLTKDPLPQMLPQYNKELDFDLVTDFGTSEHVSDHGINYDEALFSWEAIYNCWVNKFNLCKKDGWIVSENPKTGNWPKHGVNYYTMQFYTGLANISDLSIQSIDYVAAMGNVTDGWNVLCVMRKIGDKFPTLEEFQKLDLRIS